MKIILGSRSIFRRAILSKAGYDFEVMSADVDEKSIRSDNFQLLPLLIAKAKAETLLNKIHSPSILITADQVAVCDGALREKPVNKNQAREYLESYGQHPVETITAVVVTNTQTKQQAAEIDVAIVHFKPIKRAVINQLISQGNIFHAAGGFIIEDPLLKPFIDHVDGTVESVSGLPMQLTNQLINQVRE